VLVLTPRSYTMLRALPLLSAFQRQGSATITVHLWHLPITLNRNSLSKTPCFSLPPAPGPLQSAVCFPALGTSHEWNHTELVWFMSPTCFQASLCCTSCPGALWLTFHPMLTLPFLYTLICQWIVALAFFF
jgi:hypothetical protein